MICWIAGIWDTSYRYLGDYTQCLDITVTVITPCKWSQLASCCLCGTAGTYSCKKFAFSSILLCKILQSKCCSVSHWVFISPTEIRSGVSNIQGLELSEAMKILYNFHPFLPMRNPSVLPSALLAWYPRTLGHPQLCARAGISLYPVSAPRLSVTRAAVSVRSPDQAVGGTTCDPSPYIVKNI